MLIFSLREIKYHPVLLQNFLLFYSHYFKQDSAVWYGKKKKKEKKNSWLRIKYNNNKKMAKTFRVFLYYFYVHNLPILNE